MNTVGHKYNKRTVIILFSVTFTTCLTFFAFVGYVNRGWISGADAQGYYMMGRSLYFDHDFDFTNERLLDPRPENIGTDSHLTKTGKVSCQFPVGYALLVQPVFLLSDIITRCSNYLLKTTLPGDGYRGVFGLLVPFSTLLYGFIGIYLAYQIIIIFFDEVLASVSINVIVLSTSLLWYISGHVTMVHVHSFAALTALVYSIMPFFQKDISGIGVLRYVCVGSLLALATMIRSQNVIFAIIPIIAMAQHFFRRDNKRKEEPLSKLIGKISAGVFSTFICLIPQMLYMNAVYGSYFTNTYNDIDGHSFKFLKPDLAKTLLSAESGLFIWHPVSLLSCIGICLLFYRVKKQRLFILLLSVCFILTWYVIAIWDYSMANSFGNRAFDGSTLFFALGLAEILNRLREKKKIVISVCITLTLWNMQLLMQQRYFRWISYGWGRDMSYLELFKNYNKLPGEWERIKKKYL